jgi:thymidylate synthase (FAD)
MRLIRYLWTHAHSTPFESAVFTFEVKAPIFVVRQWHRHRTWTYNELSARYRELPEEFYVPDPRLVGQQSTSNKQCRVVQTLTDTELHTRQQQTELLREQNVSAFALYHRLLAEGWPRELARTVLPVSTYTHMFATVNLFNLFKFLTLRIDPHAQYEIRVYAEAIRELIRPIVPVCVRAWESTRPQPDEPTLVVAA